MDGLGNPVDFILTGGEVHDSVCAEALLYGKNADIVMLIKHMIAIKFLTLLHGWKQLLLYLLNQIEPINAAMINIIIKIVI